MADGSSTADIERLRNLNNDLLTENAECLRSTVQNVQGEYLDARNESDRVKDKLTKVNDVDKTLTVMFYAGKRKRMKDRGFMAMLIEARREYMGVKLTPESHQVFLNQMWGKIQVNESNLDKLGHVEMVSVCCGVVQSEESDAG